MSEYIRFVSYLYGYRMNTRENNLGFVKYEMRKGLRKISLQASGIQTIRNRLPIYVFYREGDSCIGIPLGNLAVRNGRGNFQFSTYSNLIVCGEDSCKFEDIAGIVIDPVEENALIVSVWDKKIFSTSMFLRGRKELLMASSVNSSEEENEEESHLNLRENEEESHLNEGETEEKNHFSSSKILAEAENDKIDNRAADNGEAKRMVPRMMTLWERLCRMYPKVVPFPYDRSILCLRIRPNDIGRLPKKYWNLAKNSFLLHSFFEYRYLLLIKVKEKEVNEETEKSIYYLAVPGAYTKMEESLAEMFDFSDFIPGPGDEKKEGESGFYLKSVELEETT